jgi:alcohol dehydrogenase
MKAFSISKYGKDSDLKQTTLPKPEINGSQLLVEIHAAGVNVLDAKLKHGNFKAVIPYDLPLILGNDLAGVVKAVGVDVADFQVGDEVYARPDQAHIGTFAEYISVDVQDVALKPNKLTMVEAASLPLVALTAWQALVEIGQLQPGQKVFIQAGSGGVGTVAIQLAKHLGAEVATTTSARNEELVRRLGADVIIDYKTQDFESVLHDYDLVLHSQDMKTLEKSLRILKRGGKLISISGPPDPEFAKAAGLSLPLRLVIKGLSLKVRQKAKKQGVDYSFLLMRAEGSQLQEITKLIDAGVITPVIDTIYPFTETPQALEHVESGRSAGKVVVSIKP